MVNVPYCHDCGEFGSTCRCDRQPPKGDENLRPEARHMTPDLTTSQPSPDVAGLVDRLKALQTLGVTRSEWWLAMEEAAQALSALSAERDELADALMKHIGDCSEALRRAESAEARVKALDKALRSSTSALRWFTANRNSLIADIRSAHSARGNGASEWMVDDDREFRRDLREALDNAVTALNEAALAALTPQEGT